MDACYNLGDDVVAFFRDAVEREESEAGREVFRQLLQNVDIARDEQMPLCQDTGLAVVFVDLGQEVHVTGGDLEAAVNEGVAKGYGDGYLRKSVGDPALRRPQEHRRQHPRHAARAHRSRATRSRSRVAPKGGGAENMSALAMLKPAQGRKAIVDFVVDTVGKAGPNACPPMVVGVGIGGTFEKVAESAKRALLRDVGSTNPVPRLAELEDELEALCNDLGIGPQGLGGRITVMDVFVEELPAHIASLPVAVNIQCHSARHKEVVL